MSLLEDPRLDALLDRLHSQSSEQDASVFTYFAQRASEGTLDFNVFDDDIHAFMSDKLIALDREKAELCYQLCRGLRAKRVVEAGTSYGVSTLYLAAAVRDNVRRDGGKGLVVGTEHEAAKADAARRHFAEGGLAEWIDLRQGDLRETLRRLEGPIDFMLVDIWTPMARPALELVAPHLRPGAMIVADNTTQFREAYTDYLSFIGDPKNGLRTMTLPYPGGLELTVRD